MDSPRRSILKSLSWRVCAWTITTVVAWSITGEAGFAAAIGVVDTLIKLGVYYAHERAWNRSQVGRLAVSESSS